MKRNEIRVLLAGLKYFYPTYFGDEPHKAEGVFRFQGKVYAKRWIVSETFRIAEIPEKTSDLGTAIRKLEGIYTNPESEAPAGNMPGSEVLSEESQKKEEERIAKVKEIEKKQKASVEEKIEREQKLYVKTKIEKPKLPEKQQVAVNDVVTQIKNTKTEESVKLISNEIRTNVPEISEDDANFTAKVIVANVYTNYTPIIKSAAVETVTQKPEYTDLASILSDQTKTSEEISELIARSREITRLAFGEEFQKMVLPNIEVEVSEVPQTGFVLVQIPRFPSATPLTSQAEIQTFGQSWIDAQLAQIQSGAIQGTDYNPKAFQSSLSLFKPLAGAAKNIALNKVTGLATKAVIEGAGIAAGPETGFLSVLASKAINLGLNLLSKIQRSLKEHPEGAVLIGAMLFAPIVLFGSTFATTLSALAGVGVAGAGIIGGASAAGLASRFRAVSLTAAGALLMTISTPVIVTIIALPIVAALILFIINSGAYIVPPSFQQLTSQNPYIDVTKVASPAGPFQNSDVTGSKPLSVTYTITVTAKKEELTKLVFQDQCSAITKAGSSGCSSPTITHADPVEVGAPFTYTYTATYVGAKFTDAIIMDTVTVTAYTQSAKAQEAVGAASITVGTPPTDCLQIDGPWRADYQANMQYAISTLVSKYSNYVSLVCSAYRGNKLLLRYNATPYDHFWGFNHKSFIDFYSLGLSSKDNALYTLSHELGHSLIWGVPGIWPAYLSYRGITSEVPTCFYTYGGDINERLPEAIAFYIIKPRCGDLQTKYPIHYQFVKQFIFK